MARSTLANISFHKPLHEPSLQEAHFLDNTPICISPIQSFEDSDTTMNLSITTESSWSTLTTDKQQSSSSSFGSIGLPSQYPGHRKSDSISTECSIVEELYDFNSFYDDESFQKILDESTRKASKKENPLKDSGTAPSKAAPRRRRAHHRRQRTEISSTKEYQDMMAASNQERRERNKGLSAQDFEETILGDLFPADFSVEAFRY